MKDTRRFYAVLISAIALAALVCLLQGCNSTVTPDIVVPTQASFSGNVRNSGIIAATPAGRIIDGNLRARYNALIDTYGREYGLQHDAGATKIMEGATPDAERWLIDRQHWAMLLEMNVKKHSGISPTK